MTDALVLAVCAAMDMSGGGMRRIRMGAPLATTVDSATDTNSRGVGQV